MKTISLSDGQEAKCDDEDFEYLSQFEWHAEPVTIRGRRTSYAYRLEAGRPIYMHDEVVRRAGGFRADGTLRRAKP